MLDLETIKTLFKQSIDESNNMSEAFERLLNKVYEKGREDSHHEVYECPWCGTVGAIKVTDQKEKT